MFGNLINNTLIKQLRAQNLLNISPFLEEELQIAQYPLRPKVVYEVDENGIIEPGHVLSDKKNTYTLKPKSYYCIDVNESIFLSKGLVGRFIPASVLIEKGLSLSAGKIEFPFGKNNEKIRFGLYNYLDVPVTIDYKERIAYIQFTDMRGLDNHEYTHTKYDEARYLSRFIKKLSDDGGNYAAQGDD